MAFRPIERGEAINDAANLRSIANISLDTLAMECNMWHELHRATNKPRVSRLIDVVRQTLGFCVSLRLMLDVGAFREPELTEYHARIGSYYSCARYMGQLLVKEDRTTPNEAYLDDHMVIPLLGFSIPDGALSIISTVNTLRDPPFAQDVYTPDTPTKEQWWTDKGAGLHLLVRQPAELSKDQASFLRKTMRDVSFDALLQSPTIIQVNPYTSLSWLEQQATF